MKIIAVSGPSNSGKTSTLSLLFEKLTDDVDLTAMSFELTNDKRTHDFMTIFKYKHNEVTKNIGIYTGGDNENIVQKALAKMNNPMSDPQLKKLGISKVNVVFIACRTKGKALDLINKEPQKGNQVEYVDVTRLKDNTVNTVSFTKNESDSFNSLNDDLIYEIINRNVELLKIMIEHS